MVVMADTSLCLFPSADLVIKRRSGYIAQAVWLSCGYGQEWEEARNKFKGLRHTFCSCWLAKHEYVNKLFKTKSLFPVQREIQHKAP